jgi:hypothetical protein
VGAENRKQCNNHNNSDHGVFRPIPEGEPHFNVVGNIHRAPGGVILTGVIRIRGHAFFPILLQQMLRNYIKARFGAIVAPNSMAWRPFVAAQNNL